MNPSPRQLLGHVHGGRVLDLATGAGGFVATLVEGLARYDEIVGLDSDPAKATAFTEAMRDRPRTRFVVGDASATGCADDSFDTVAVSNSLHHFADPAGVLNEALRVLRPGGWLIVFEMYRDRQLPPQVTHVELHHWWAAIDALRGVTHRETYSRGELRDLARPLNLADMRVTDVSNPEDDPLDPESIAEMSDVIDRYLALAAGHPDLVARGEALRRRLEKVGIRGATSLCIVGRRPAADRPTGRAPRG